MILLEPYLFVERLVIIANSGETAYDEFFHLGSNIIRGRNSSGKSTVANFIFYALGGDTYRPTDAANECREIYAQVKVSGAVMTLKRPIARSHHQPMSIFWGTFEEAKKSNFKGWSHYPYRETVNKESFSNILFNAMGLPLVRSDSDSKITMHQLLRLIFVDQESPSENLFRFERFDQPLTRQTVAELLIGVYDDELYSERLLLREQQKKLEDKQTELRGIQKVLESSGQQDDLGRLRKDLAKAHEQLITVESEVTTLRNRATVKLQANSSPQVLKAQEEFLALRQELSNATNRLKSLEFDVVDSQQFIQTLEERIQNLSDSSRAKKVLGELPLEFCPQCMRPLVDHELATPACSLCKNPFEENFEAGYVRRLEQELRQQIKESKTMLEEKQIALSELASKHSQIVEQYRVKQRAIDADNNRATSTRDQRIDALLIKKGNTQATIKYVSEKIQALQLLETLSKEIKALQGSVGELRRSIEVRSNKEQQNINRAMRKIEAITLELLRADLHRQQQFQSGKKIEIDFRRDVFSLDEQNNFSASSNVLFKNAVRFAIFFASLELKFFRFPRLIICDNMEDKGMEEERSQNFQRVIVGKAESYNVAHQLIFTTSKIDPSLEKPKYTIGKNYSETSKSIRNVDAT